MRDPSQSTQEKFEEIATKVGMATAEVLELLDIASCHFLALDYQAIENSLCITFTYGHGMR